MAGFETFILFSGLVYPFLLHGLSERGTACGEIVRIKKELASPNYTFSFLIIDIPTDGSFDNLQILERS